MPSICDTRVTGKFQQHGRSGGGRVVEWWLSDSGVVVEGWWSGDGGVVEWWLSDSGVVVEGWWSGG